LGGQQGPAMGVEGGGIEFVADRVARRAESGALMRGFPLWHGSLGWIEDSTRLV
jgi:hypothetical protein